jgi:hypothetical protein
MSVMSKPARKIEEIICLRVSETTATDAEEETQTKRRIYSIRVTRYGKALLLVALTASVVALSSGIGGLKGLVQKLF